MPYGLNEQLLVAAGFAVTGTFLILRRDLGAVAALILALFKALVPVVYFAWFFDGTWTFRDDYAYMEHGKALLANGFTPLEALTSAEGLLMLGALAGSAHILYSWFNHLAFWLFGVAYYSPIFLNVVLTAATGWYLYRILERLEFPEVYRRWCVGFFLVHPEVLAWSSFANLKDLLVMFLSAALLYHVMGLTQKMTLRGVAMVGLLVGIFGTVRFYVPAFILGAWGVWLVLHGRKKRRLVLAAAAVVVVLAVVPLTAAMNLIAPASAPVGAIRYVLSPRPWATDASYGFLGLPMVFHWLMIVPALVAGIAIWRSNTLARLPLLYVLLTVVVYAAAPMFHGPRHRVQMLFVVAWLQFHVLAVVARAVSEAELERLRELQPAS